MFALCSDITIGKFDLVKPISVKINKSVYEYADRAIIKIPITARIILDGQVITESAETAKKFDEGDNVLIKLGYNGNLKNEFEGFISRINFSSPLEIECEGFSYQLRKKTYLKTFSNTELKSVLEYLIQGTGIKLDSDIPSFKIEKLILKNNNGIEAIEKIKKISDNNLKIFFTGNLLYAGLEYLNLKADVKYRLGWNVIKDGNLKKREAKNLNITVHYIGENKDGSKEVVKSMHNKTVELSSIPGETIKITTHAIRDKNTLKGMADSKLKSLSFDGYEGKITAFGTPYCEPGYRAILEDNKFGERSGKYFVESIEVNYSQAGFRRQVGIGAKL